MNSVDTMTSLGRQLAKHSSREYLADSSICRQRKEISCLGTASPKKITKWNHNFASLFTDQILAGKSVRM